MAQRDPEGAIILITNYIMTCKYGECVGVRWLAKALKISRGRVSRAFRKLEERGMVRDTKQPGVKKWVVEHIQALEDIKAFLYIRIVIEINLVGEIIDRGIEAEASNLLSASFRKLKQVGKRHLEAIDKESKRHRKERVEAADAFNIADMDMHKILYDVCGISAASDVLFFLREKIRSSYMEDVMDCDRVERVLREHERWLDAIRSDALPKEEKKEEAIAAMRDHLDLSCRMPRSCPARRSGG